MRLPPRIIRTSCREKELEVIEVDFCPIVKAAMIASENAPRDVQEISGDKEIVEVAKRIFEASELASSMERAATLVSFVNSLEQSVRHEIKSRAQMIVDDISADIRDMWAILHPQEPIKDVHLYLPEGADKAIDIGLTFHDVKQDSPRLTLSEAIATASAFASSWQWRVQEPNEDRPLILDDVVVSFDRNHRV